MKSHLQIVSSRAAVLPRGARSQQPVFGMAPAAAPLRGRVALAIIGGIAAGALITGFVVMQGVNVAGCHVSVCGYEGEH